MDSFILKQQTNRKISIFSILGFIATLSQILKIERLINSVILLIVRGYQLYISPYKGFCCAYRKLHNGQSCSSYFYTCVNNYDLSTAGILLQQRFKDCKQANAILKSQTNQQKKHNSQKQRKKNNSDCACCALEFLTYFSILGCGDTNSGTNNSGSCCGETNYNTYNSESCDCDDCGIN